MENITSTIDEFLPLVVVTCLVLFMLIEVWLPYFQTSAYRKTQRWHNLGNVVIAFIFNALLGGLVAWFITESSRLHFGLLYHLPLPAWAAFLAGILLSDLNAYVMHRIYHKVPLLWRFHTIHHSDIELDASTGLRIHPVEFLIQTASQAIVLPLLGVSLASFVVYALFLVTMAIINHANVKFPDWYEKYVGLIFVTPNFHRVHHSSYQPETDSNFAEVFSFWDPLFGTKTNKKPEELTYGLEIMREKESQTFWGMLKAPFGSLK